MRYRFKNLAFDVPDGLVDQSMVVLVDDDSLALTLAREARTAPLKAYVDEALKELMGSVSGFVLERREDRTVGGKGAVVLGQSALTPEGRPVAQLQAYIDLGAEVAVVTATAPQEHGARAASTFERVLSSMQVE